MLVKYIEKKSFKTLSATSYEYTNFYEYTTSYDYTNMHLGQHSLFHNRNSRSYSLNLVHLQTHTNLRKGYETLSLNLVPIAISLFDLKDGGTFILS